MDDLRLFISVNIDNQQIKSAISVFQHQLDFPGIRLVEPDLFHFSLHFLGDTSNDLLPKLTNVLSSVKQAPFTVSLNGVGVFPSLRNIKVIWAGVSAGSDELQSLKQQLEKPLEQLGFTVDPRPFTPHLTIGRVKFIKAENKPTIQKRIAENKSMNFGSQNVLAVHLMQSILRPEGPIYHSLVTQDLEE